MNFCDACGRPLKGGYGIGGAMLCRTCEPDITAEINKLHAAGKPVNALQIAKQIFRDFNSAGNYYLRDIPDALWTQVKHRAVDEKISLRELILKALYKYLED